MSEEFSRRTKIISGTNYHVAIWRGKNKKGKPVGLTSFDTEERAKTFCESLSHKPYYEITPNTWSKTICIECGEEIYW